MWSLAELERRFGLRIHEAAPGDGERKSVCRPICSGRFRVKRHDMHIGRSMLELSLYFVIFGTRLD